MRTTYDPYDVAYLTSCNPYTGSAPVANGWLTPALPTTAATAGPLAHVYPRSTVYSSYPAGLAFPGTWTFDLSGLSTAQRASLGVFYSAQPRGALYQATAASLTSGLIGTATATGTSGLSGNSTTQVLWTIANAAAAFTLATTATSPANAGSDSGYMGGIIDFYDLSQPQDANVVFIGDSITFGWAGHGVLPDSGYTGADSHSSWFSQAIHDALGISGLYPLMLNDGVVGSSTLDLWDSTNGVPTTRLVTAVNAIPGGFVIVAMGTNDCNALGNSATPAQVAAFATGDYHDRMVAIAGYIKSRGKVPIVPYIPWNKAGNTASGGSVDYADAVPLLNAQLSRIFATDQSILQGPDFYSFFRDHPYLLTDPTNNPHPQSIGYDAMHLLWENWFLLNVYKRPDLLYFNPQPPGDLAPTLSNGSFENGDLRNWHIQAPSPATGVSTSSPHGGTWCAAVHGDAQNIDQQVSGLAPSSTYTLSAWVKGDGVSTTGLISVSGTGITSGAAPSAAGTSWVQQTVTFTTGASATVATITLNNSTASSTVWYDDVTLSGPGVLDPIPVPRGDVALTPGAIGAPGQSWTIIAPGATVSWFNAAVAARTLAADDGSWSVGPIASGATGSHTFAAEGVYPYHDSGAMALRGVVLVRSAALPAPYAH